jgi:hypothetical protein
MGTVPVLKFENGTAIICQIIKPIRQESAINRYGERSYVTHIRSPKGAERKLIVGVVMRGALEAKYDNQSYVGRWFHIHKHAPAKGKRYLEYTISEVRPPQPKTPTDLNND